MDEVETFRKLKQIPLDEMVEKIDIKNFEPPMPHAYQLGSKIVDSALYYNRELQIHHWRIKLFERYGWTFDEFMLESEKRSIIRQVEEFNREYQIPQELIDRAHQLFPNARFVHASVELE